MKKIVFITNSIGFGGAEKMLVFVANSLSARGHKCCIINLNAIGDYINEKKQKLEDGVVLHTIQPQDSNTNKHLYRVKSIKAIAKSFGADIIIGFTSYPNFYAKIVGLSLRIPTIMSERGDPSKTTNNSLKSKFVDFFINRSKGGVFQTEGAMSFYGKGLRKRSVVIPNPIFAIDEIPTVLYEEREKSIVTVGRLDNFQKRYDVMLDAFKLFSEKHPEYVLKMYGRGSDEELIKKWVSERSLCEKVRFMGLSTHPMLDICRDGMFLITSDFEGISNALLEAMAAGLPCVSTDHTPGGARLLIQDHQNGLLAPIGDSKRLAEAMCEFADDPELAEACGEKAKEVLVRFSPEHIIDLWEEYINRIC